MIRYRYLNEILGSPWMLEPQTAAAYLQLLRGVLMGLQLEKEDDTELYYYIDADCPSNVCYRQKELTKGHAINVVELEGVMTKADGYWHDGTKSIASYLLEEDANDYVVGHILKINSGGGAANSVPVLADAIGRLTKPIVAFVDGMMCSAAMYAGSYCKHIIASSKNDRIGCIGTMIEIMDYPKQANLPDGMVTLRIYATDSTEKNLEYEEALKGNVELIRNNMLDPINKDFVNAIKANRPCATEAQLKGMTYFAQDVVGTLIDEIGGFETAVQKVKEMAGIGGENEDNNKNITNHSTMKFANINKIASCASVETQDGSATLSEAQLNDIETNFSAAVTRITEMETELAEAKQNVTTLTDSVKQKDERIKELEHIIDAADDGVKNAHHNGQQVEETDETEKARQACREFLKNI